MIEDLIATMRRVLPTALPWFGRLWRGTARFGDRSGQGTHQSGAGGRVLRARFLGLAFVLSMVAAVALAAGEERPIIQEVVVVGGTTISAETVEYYLGVAQGDPFDPDMIAKSFTRFWDSGSWRS